jgi:hypothetical protein
MKRRDARMTLGLTEKTYSDGMWKPVDRWTPYNEMQTVT